MNERLDEYCALVYNEIKNKATKLRPIKLSTLRQSVNLNRRQIQKVLFELRKTYPIVAKETDGGGYWLAQNEEDVIQYITMMQNRVNGYNETIKLMNNFIADYGNIPYVD